MLSECIKLGDRIEITSKNEDGSGKFFVSQVEAIIDAKRLVVHLPISYGQLIKLNTETVYFFVFFTDKGMLRFEVKVIKMFKEHGFYLMQISLLTPGERVQRREYYRFSCMLPLKFSVINENDLEAKMPQYQGIVKDISGGGIRFVSNDEVDETENLKCIIMLNKEILLAIGKILHKQYFRKSTYKYQYRIMFIGILPTEREKIVQYIFNEQRRILRRTGD